MQEKLFHQKLAEANKALHQASWLLGGCLVLLLALGLSIYYVKTAQGDVRSIAGVMALTSFAGAVFCLALAKRLHRRMQRAIAEAKLLLKDSKV